MARLVKLWCLRALALRLCGVADFRPVASFCGLALLLRFHLAGSCATAQVEPQTFVIALWLVLVQPTQWRTLVAPSQLPYQPLRFHLTLTVSAPRPTQPGRTPTQSRTIAPTAQAMALAPAQAAAAAQLKTAVCRPYRLATTHIPSAELRVLRVLAGRMKTVRHTTPLPTL